MKHKHYEMIMAKAENMELTTLVKFGKEWMISAPHTVGEIISFDSRYEYFLCLPQHKEFCLHWLNGGDIQDFFEEEWSDCASLAHTTEVGGDNTLEFSMYHMFMNEEFNFRIKPKKEKRWIGYCASRNQTIPHPQDSEQLAMDYTALHYSYHVNEWQFIEIEVEV